MDGMVRGRAADIYLRATLKYIPTAYKLVNDGDDLRLEPMTGPVISTDGLSLLLNSPGVLLSRNDTLVPCFDLKELSRKNQFARRK